jgi:hypothetical protein
MCNRPAAHYRLPRHKQHPEFTLKLILIAAALAFAGLTYLVGTLLKEAWDSHTPSVVMLESLKKSNAELVAVLSGKLVMHEEGQEYGKIAEVKWTLVKEMK